MKLLTTSPVRYTTVKLIGRLLQPLSESGLISVPELNNIMSNLRHLSQKGELVPDVLPKLIDQREAGEMLGIGLSNFKNIERAGGFPFKRRRIGTAVRYLNTDIIHYILALAPDNTNPEESPVDENLPESKTA